MVLEIDGAKRRVSLGLKQTHAQPLGSSLQKAVPCRHPTVEGEVKNITEFGSVRWPRR